MICTIEQLKERYANIHDKKGKIARDIKAGKLFPLVRGIYETDSHTDGIKLSQFIYGPSYVSFDYVLAKEGLIPEAVYTYTCACYNKRKVKNYHNRFGNYSYRDIPKEVFSFGVNYITDGLYSYQIATPEKALCDKLYSMPPVRSIKDIKVMLFEDLRIDETRFKELNKEDMIKISPMYHSNNLKYFAKYLQGK